MVTPKPAESDALLRDVYSQSEEDPALPTTPAPTRRRVGWTMIAAGLIPVVAVCAPRAWQRGASVVYTRVHHVSADGEADPAAISGQGCPDVVDVSCDEHVQPKAMGTFTKTNMSKNGRPTYVHDTDQYLYYWEPLDRWKIGRRYNDSYSEVSSTEGPLCPNQVPAGSWLMWHGRGWKTAPSFAVSDKDVCDRSTAIRYCDSLAMAWKIDHVNDSNGSVHCVNGDASFSDCEGCASYRVVLWKHGGDENTHSACNVHCGPVGGPCNASQGADHGNSTVAPEPTPGADHGNSTVAPEPTPGGPCNASQGADHGNSTVAPEPTPGWDHQSMLFVALVVGAAGVFLGLAPFAEKVRRAPKPQPVVSWPGVHIFDWDHDNSSWMATPGMGTLKEKVDILPRGPVYTIEAWIRLKDTKASHTTNWLKDTKASHNMCIAWWRNRGKVNALKLEVDVEEKFWRLKSQCGDDMMTTIEIPGLPHEEFHHVAVTRNESRCCILVDFKEYPLDDSKSQRSGRLGVHDGPEVEGDFRIGEEPQSTQEQSHKSISSADSQIQNPGKKRNKIQYEPMSNNQPMNEHETKPMPTNPKERSEATEEAASTFNKFKGAIKDLKIWNVAQDVDELQDSQVPPELVQVSDSDKEIDGWYQIQHNISPLHNRPIYWSRSGHYLYYWHEHNSWRIGPSYLSGAAKVTSEDGQGPVGPHLVARGKWYVCHTDDSQSKWKNQGVKVVEKEFEFSSKDMEFSPKAMYTIAIGDCQPLDDVQWCCGQYREGASTPTADSKRYLLGNESGLELASAEEKDELKWYFEETESCIQIFQKDSQLCIRDGVPKCVPKNSPDAKDAQSRWHIARNANGNYTILLASRVSSPLCEVEGKVQLGHETKGQTAEWRIEQVQPFFEDAMYSIQSVTEKMHVSCIPGANGQEDNYHVVLCDDPKSIRAHWHVKHEEDGFRIENARHRGMYIGKESESVNLIMTSSKDPTKWCIAPTSDNAFKVSIIDSPQKPQLYLNVDQTRIGQIMLSHSDTDDGAKWRIFRSLQREENSASQWTSTLLSISTEQHSRFEILNPNAFRFSMDDYREFSDLAHVVASNPRRLKRMKNSYSVHKLLVESSNRNGCTGEFREKMLRWTVMCEQWPVRVSWLIQILLSEKQEFEDEFTHGQGPDMHLFEFYKRFAEPRLYEALFESGRADKSAPSQEEPRDLEERLHGELSKLLRLDSDARAFDILLSRQPPIQVKDLWNNQNKVQLLSLTTNLNPAVRFYLAHVHGTTCLVKNTDPRWEREQYPEYVRESMFKRPDTYSDMSRIPGFNRAKPYDGSTFFDSLVVSFDLQTPSWLAGNDEANEAMKNLLTVVERRIAKETNIDKANLHTQTKPHASWGVTVMATDITQGGNGDVDHMMRKIQRHQKNLSNDIDRELSKFRYSKWKLHTEPKTSRSMVFEQKNIAVSTNGMSTPKLPSESKVRFIQVSINQPCSIDLELLSEGHIVKTERIIFETPSQHEQGKEMIRNFDDRWSIVKEATPNCHYRLILSSEADTVASSPDTAPSSRVLIICDEQYVQARDHEYLNGGWLTSKCHYFHLDRDAKKPHMYRYVEDEDTHQWCGELTLKDEDLEGTLQRIDKFRKGTDTKERHIRITLLDSAKGLKVVNKEEGIALDEETAMKQAERFPITVDTYSMLHKGSDEEKACQDMLQWITRGLLSDGSPMPVTRRNVKIHYFNPVIMVATITAKQMGGANNAIQARDRIRGVAADLSNQIMHDLESVRSIAKRVRNGVWNIPPAEVYLSKTDLLVEFIMVSLEYEGNLSEEFLASLKKVVQRHVSVAAGLMSHEVDVKKKPKPGPTVIASSIKALTEDESIVDVMKTIRRIQPEVIASLKKDCNAEVEFELNSFQTGSVSADFILKETTVNRKAIKTKLEEMFKTTNLNHKIEAPTCMEVKATIYNLADFKDWEQHVKHCFDNIGALLSDETFRGWRVFPRQPVHFQHVDLEDSICWDIGLVVKSVDKDRVLQDLQDKAGHCDWHWESKFEGDVYSICADSKHSGRLRKALLDHQNAGSDNTWPNSFWEVTPPAEPAWWLLALVPKEDIEAILTQKEKQVSLAQKGKQILSDLLKFGGMAPDRSGPVDDQDIIQKALGILDNGKKRKRLNDQDETRPTLAVALIVAYISAPEGATVKQFQDGQSQDIENIEIGDRKARMNRTEGTPGSWTWTSDPVRVGSKGKLLEEKAEYGYMVAHITVAGEGRTDLEEELDKFQTHIENFVDPKDAVSCKLIEKCDMVGVPVELNEWAIIREMPYENISSQSGTKNQKEEKKETCDFISFQEELQKKYYIFPTRFSQDLVARCIVPSSETEGGLREKIKELVSNMDAEASEKLMLKKETDNKGVVAEIAIHEETIEKFEEKRPKDGHYMQMRKIKRAIHAATGSFMISQTGSNVVRSEDHIKHHLLLSLNEPRDDAKLPNVERSKRRRVELLALKVTKDVYNLVTAIVNTDSQSATPENDAIIFAERLKNALESGSQNTMKAINATWLGATVTKAGWRSSAHKQLGNFDNDASAGADLVEYNMYAEVLARVALCVPRCPMVIGLYASWGTGKSFIMSKMQSQLQYASLLSQYKGQPGCEAREEVKKIQVDMQGGHWDKIQKQWEERQKTNASTASFSIMREIKAYFPSHLELLRFCLSCLYTSLVDRCCREQNEGAHDEERGTQWNTRHPDGREDENDGVAVFEYTFVWFNSWLYNGTDHLWAALVLHLYEGVERHYGSSYTYARRRALLWKVITDVIAVVVILGVAFFLREHLGTWRAHILTAVGAAGSLLPAGLGLRDLYYMISDSATVAEDLSEKARSDLKGQLGVMRLVKEELKNIGAMLDNPGDVPSAWDYYLDETICIPSSWREKAIKDLNPYKDWKKCRFVVFVDDLDRCDPKKCVEVISAVSLLCEDLPFVIVLAIDPRVVVASIESANDDFFTKKQISGYEYLDKIVQIPFAIPELDTDDRKKMLQGLVAGGKVEGDDGVE